jgi:hypothetical protein
MTDLAIDLLHLDIQSNADARRIVRVVQRALQLVASQEGEHWAVSAGLAPDATPGSPAAPGGPAEGGPFTLGLGPAGADDEAAAAALARVVSGAVRLRLVVGQ